MPCFRNVGFCQAAGRGAGAGGLTASPADAATAHPPVEILLAVTPPLNDRPPAAVRHVTEYQERLSVCSGPDPIVAGLGLFPMIHCRAI